LTIANVFASWRRASENHNYVGTFCKKNYLSHQVSCQIFFLLQLASADDQNLQQIEALRQQYLGYLIDASLVEATPAERQELNQ
jgi:ATP-dependent RNA helicase DHX29